MIHTHQRPDRDNYITVDLNNIQQDWRQHYKPLQISDTDQTLGPIPYDERSFMHYKAYDNTIDRNKPAMTSKVGILVSNDLE